MQYQLEPIELGKWYVSDTGEASRESLRVAGPFDSQTTAEAERQILVTAAPDMAPRLKVWYAAADTVEGSVAGASILKRNKIQAGENNNYLIGGNITNAFAIGNLGSVDDFFLVGAEPEAESNYPLLTGNILDSEGKVLFRLVRNLLVLNPGHCSRIFGDHIGYEIHDSAGNMILSVKTVFETLPGESQPCYVTTLNGQFYDKSGSLVFRAGADDCIESTTKACFGFNGERPLLGMRLDDGDAELIALAWATGGRINQVIRGVTKSETVELDGKCLIEARLLRCHVIVRTGDFSLRGASEFHDCKIELQGPAQMIAELLSGVRGQPPEPPEDEPPAH